MPETPCSSALSINSLSPVPQFGLHTQRRQFPSDRRNFAPALKDDAPESAHPGPAEIRAHLAINRQAGLRIGRHRPCHALILADGAVQVESRMQDAVPARHR